MGPHPAFFGEISAPPRAGIQRKHGFVRGFLVYNQSWEDPVPDLSALRPGPRDRVLTVASGGCNVLHLAATGAEVLAVDRNPAQVALADVKLTAARALPPAEFRRIFSTGVDPRGLLLDLDLTPPAGFFLRRRAWFGGRGLYAAGVFGWAGRALRAWVRMTGARPHVEAAFAAGSLAEQSPAWGEASRRMRRGPGAPALRTRLPLLAFGVPLRVSGEIPGSSAAIADGVDRIMASVPARENWFWRGF